MNLEQINCASLMWPNCQYCLLYPLESNSQELVNKIQGLLVKIHTSDFPVFKVILKELFQFKASISLFILSSHLVLLLCYYANFAETATYRNQILALRMVGYYL